MSAITIIHQCRYLFCEILSFNPYPFREVPSFNPLHLFMCCLFFHLHSSVHLFPSHLLIVFLSNYISTRNFPYFLLSWFFSISPVFISYTHLSPVSVLPCSLLPHQPGLLLYLQPCIHTSHCFPSHDGCTHLEPCLILLALGMEKEQDASRSKRRLQGTN